MAEDKNNPLVSIVTPVYNAEDFILESIQSVKAQSYKNWELILIDDKSTDSSAYKIIKEAERDKRIKLIQNKHNMGAAASRNIGIGTAKGRFLAFLDADDVWMDNKLETQLSFMLENDIYFTFTSYKFANEDLSKLGKKIPVPSKITYSQSLRNHIIWTSTVLIDLLYVDKSLVLMPDVKRGQDAATWWQILRTHKYAYGINDVLSLYRRTHTSLSANKLKAIKRTWYLFRRVERLNLPQSCYNFIGYAINATIKRI